MIKEMTINDIDKILVIEDKSFATPWQKKDFLYELNENPYAKYYILEIDNKIIGYIGLWIIFEKAQITNICIDKNYRNKGYGNILLNKAIDISNENNCENISLEVRVSNTKAINLYKKNGFITANIRKSYYSDNNEDAYLMIKALGGNFING